MEHMHDKGQHPSPSPVSGLRSQGQGCNRAGRGRGRRHRHRLRLRLRSIAFGNWDRPRRSQRRARPIRISWTAAA